MRAQVERVLHSATLQNAPMLQRLLEFLASRGKSGDGSGITEYTLATEVLGRNGFDPGGDTSVRTAVYRLRSKLREYYASEGKSDGILIEIPKGRYCLQLSRQELGFPEVQAPETRAPENGLEVPPPEPARRGGRRLVVAAIAISAFAAGLTVAALGLRTSPIAGAARGSGLVSFWRTFAGPDHTVLIAFANAEMLHTESGDLLKFDSGAVDDRGAKVERQVAEAGVSSPALLANSTYFYEDGYSGTGEVQAMYHLTRLLSSAGVDMLIKRSRLVTSDDLRRYNVLLLGAGRENIPVDQLHLKQGYVFETPRHVMWSNSIHDTQGALPDGRASYTVVRDPQSGTLKTDFAVFSLLPGLAPHRRIMILAGLTTSGTQGAAEFATSENQMASLITRFAAAVRQRTAPLPPYFESILEVQVIRGLDPISVRCIAARPIGATNQ